MKKTIQVAAVAGVLALSGAALAPMVMAQDGPPRHGRMGGPGGPGIGSRGGMGLLGDLGRGFRALNLTDGQREQIRGIMGTHQAELEEIGGRMRAAHQGMEALITADTVDEPAIRAKSAEAAAVQADSAVLRARVHQEVFSILTAEQQAKAKELRAAADARMKERAQRRQKP